ncbi:uncharacterized protein C6orf47 homolog [Antennarius striatus]|uniref:uncharacterized protein C6orf47 homolog n=1 Tax=Antennarius striatus TaxID=241820 RepID=UPI0035B2CC8B
MAAVLGKAWTWAYPRGSATVSEKTTATTAEGQKKGAGWISWIWGGWRVRSEQASSGEEFWEAQEKLHPMEIEDVRVCRQEPETPSEPVSKWWKYLPTSYLPWPRKTESCRPKERRQNDRKEDVGHLEADADFSDYGTPPPSPTPPSPLTSPFRLFANSCKVEILPEHHEICFNFLRHLFDLCVVGFLWTVSPPAKLILEVVGVQGALRLWFHGMAMFIVSTVGMAGLLWLIQEYLPQFALIYGVAQALVISVSVRQSVILSVEDNKDEEADGTDALKDKSDRKELDVSVKDEAKPET